MATLYKFGRDNFRFSYGLLGILLLGFILRVFALRVGIDLPTVRDEITYLKLAHSLLQDPLSYIEIFRPPLYPAFLAFNIRFFGDTRFSIGFVQALLDTCTIALVFAISQRLFHKSRVGLLAAFLYAVYPEAIELSRSLFSESLFLFISGCGFFLLLDRYKHNSYLRFLFAGLLFALAALTREILVYFIVLIIPLWIWITRAPRYRSALIQSLCFLGGVSLIFTPWVVRNWQIENRLVLVSTSGELNLVNDNTRVFRAMVNRNQGTLAQIAIARTLPLSKNQIRAMLRQRAPAERSWFAVQLAWRSITLDTLTWLGKKTNTVGYLWSPDSTYTPFTRTPLGDTTILKSIAGFYAVVLLCLAVLGLFFAPGNSSKLLIALYFIYSCGIFLLTHFLIRFRVPLVMLFIPYVALAILEWRIWLKPSRRSLAALSVVVLFIALAMVQ